MPGATAQKLELQTGFESDFALPEQKYAGSNSAFIAYGGSLALKDQVRIEMQASSEPSAESLQSNEAKAVKTDFSNGVAEMLSTDKEFSEHLHIEEIKTYKVKNGTIYSEDGRDMVKLVQNGATKSAKDAQKHPEFVPIAERDEGDNIVIEKVKNLKPGQTHIAGSLAPKEAQKKFPKFMKSLGFNDVTYLQYYSMNEDGTLEAGFISVKQTDLNAWVKIMQNEGAEIPEDVDCNTFIRHGVTLDLDTGQALRKVKQIRQDYYDEIGADYGEIVSVNEFVAQNHAVIDAVFNQYYPALSQAAYSGENHPALRQYARDVLSNKDMKGLKQELRRDLIKVANGNKFDGQLAQTMDQMFRYAAVEILRTELPRFLNKSVKANFEAKVSGVAITSASTGYQASIQYVDMNNFMISHTREGMKNKREYGGCPGNSAMTEENGAFSSTSELGQQMNFGGYGRGRFGRERWRTKKGKCVVEKCPTKPKEVEIGPCGVCMERCQKLFDKGVDPTKSSSTKKAKINYSDKPKEFTTGFFNNSTVRSNVKFKMPTKAESRR